MVSVYANISLSNMRNRFTPVLGVILLLAAAACGGDSAAAPPAGGGPARGGGQTVPVATAVVEMGAINREVSVSGVVEPIRTVGVNSQMSGALIAVPVEAGEMVRAGQLMARIDDRELAVQQASAEAAHTVARAAYERSVQLRERQVITIDEYERDRTAFAAAEGQLGQIRTRRAYATVEAPVTGVILEKMIEAGDIVSPQMRLFTIGEISTLVVRVPVSELDVVSLAPGERVQVTLDAYPGQSLVGQIRRIFPAADPATRLVPVEVALEGAAVAKPGFLARVTFPISSRSGVILVPASAIRTIDGQPTVFLVQGTSAIQRSVTVGASSQGRIEIVSGVKVGDTIVVSGNTTLRDGAAIRIVSGVGATQPGETTDGGGPQEGAN